jgi:hypothetical protein
MKEAFWLRIIQRIPIFIDRYSNQLPPKKYKERKEPGQGEKKRIKWEV